MRYRLASRNASVVEAPALKKEAIVRSTFSGTQMPIQRIGNAMAQKAASNIRRVRLSRLTHLCHVQSPQDAEEGCWLGIRILLAHKT